MSLPPSNSPGSAPSPIRRSPLSAGNSELQPGCEFTLPERALLLGVAHQSIVAAVSESEPRTVSLDPPTPHLAEFRGVFTSLYLRRDLRGCVGYVFPTCTLYRAVAETARAAAFDDTRFSRVTKEEAPQLEIELSVLSRPEPIRAEEVEIGRHGLVITLHGRRGLLLPQVPAERGWNRETFLEQTCRKAGLSPDAWQKGATLEAFTAEIFGDKDSSG
ncbi:MAG: AmmeMemoRadiSam system protein A [Candidatus Sulfotelmatobacter sp.]